MLCGLISFWENLQIFATRYLAGMFCPKQQSIRSPSHPLDRLLCLFALSVSELNGEVPVYEFEMDMTEFRIVGLYD